MTLMWRLRNGIDGLLGIRNEIRKLRPSDPHLLRQISANATISLRCVQPADTFISLGLISSVVLVNCTVLVKVLETGVIKRIQTTCVLKFVVGIISIHVFPYYQQNWFIAYIIIYLSNVDRPTLKNKLNFAVGTEPIGGLAF